MGSDEWIERTRSRLFQIDGVESLYMTRDENTVDIWVIIPGRDFDLVRRIAEAQRAIGRDFVTTERAPVFSFDFHTMYRGEHREDEMVPSRAILLSHS